MRKIKKESINKLIDTLIRTSSNQNPLSKLTDILKVILNTQDVKIIRSTLLLCLDTMHILTYDRQAYKFSFNRPSWFLSSENNKYILLGALTENDIVILDNLAVKKFEENNVIYKNIYFELPDSYYTEDITMLNKSGFKINQVPYFLDILSVTEYDDAIKNLISNELSINRIDEIVSISFVKNVEYAVEFIQSQDQVQIFDWTSRNFIKADLQNELEDPEGVKLIKVIKKRGSLVSQYFEVFILLLEKIKGIWHYTYFDSTIIDERWARFSYLSKLYYFDLHKELKNLDQQDYIYLFKNLQSLVLKQNTYIEELDLSISSDLQQSNEIIKIPKDLLNQFIRYDEVNRILAVPVTLPLPQRILRSLYSCSGFLPLAYINKFRINPRYIIKLLFAGSLVKGSREIDYPEEPYFIEEELHLYQCVPPELAEIIFKKLNLKMSKEVFTQELN